MRSLPRAPGAIHFKSLAAITSMALTALACTNGARSISSSPAVAVATSGTTSSTTTPLITITNVLRDTIDPSGTLDIIGDNTTAIGTYCVSTASPVSNTGTSTCVCNYSFTPSTSTSSETISVDTTYHEGNLIKCSMSQIPNTVTSVQVSVTITTESNTTLPFTFNTLINSSGLNTSSASSFAPVIRYTCRDIVTIEDLFDSVEGGGSGIYDPLQSEDASISYPIDFYATNLGGVLNAYAGGVSGVNAPTSWNCPSDPLNPSSDFHVTLYSQTPLNGSNVISGMDNANNPTAMSSFNPRSTFYLATSQSGVFSKPVNAYVAPTIVSYDLTSSGATQGGVPPIGYGAAPVAGTVSGTESCPGASVPIPAGYSWVKVWLFRATLPTRQYLNSSVFQQLGNIDCNPGMYPGYPTQSYSTEGYLDLPFSDCYNSPSLDSPNADGMANRFFESTGMCVNVNPGGTTSVAGTTASLTAPYSGYNHLPQYGTDIWIPVTATTTAAAPAGYPITPPTGFGYGPVSCTDPNTGTRGVSVFDPVNLCSTAISSMPNDLAPVASNIDDPSNPRFDYVFVTTPPTVMTSDMSNSSSPIYQQYAPYRFRADSDCGKSNPDSAGCNLNYAFTTYGIKFYDVGTAGDAPTTGTTASFPVCALQPTN